jgi:vancomycin resistance protein YoaR
MLKHLRAYPRHHILLYAFLSVLFFILLFGAGTFIFSQVYLNRFYPGVKVAGIKMSGESFDSARAKLQPLVDSLENNPVILTLDGKRVEFSTKSEASDPDLSYQLININIDQALSDAYAYGRQGSWLSSWNERYRALFFGKTINPVVEVDEARLRPLLQQKLAETFAPAQDAELITAPEAPQPALPADQVFVAGNQLSFYIRPEIFGWNINLNDAIARLKDNLTAWSSAPIALAAEKVAPTIVFKDLGNWQNQTKDLLAAAPLILQATDKNNLPWTRTLTADDLAPWLSLSKTATGTIVSWDEVKIAQYLDDKVSSFLNLSTDKAQFSVSGDKVGDFKINTEGRSLEIDSSASLIRIALEKGSNQKVVLAMKTVPAQLSSDLKALGIKEIIGTGHSNFANSPVNRRHNIQVGADALNGVLIKPGEEFSLLKALGKIDADHGYLSELVIKANKTVPEFGGGLCQIGTTIFRATLSSGLPITMRRNHSYRVVYYEPAGTDATIYDPWPDYKFINDTGNYVMIETRFAGKDDLYFNFWGTNDGRVVSTTAPTIYNIVKPEPTKIVETTDLPVGKKKCTESAHNGADAYFDYTVTYPATSSEAVVAKKRFSSHYIPWQAVCMLGVKATSTPAVIGNSSASSTKAATSTSGQ